MTNRKYSKDLVDGPNQAASRSMLRGAGFTSEDFNKPFVGIASTGAKVTPCNMHINDLADVVEGKAVVPLTKAELEARQDKEDEALDDHIDANFELMGNDTRDDDD